MLESDPAIPPLFAGIDWERQHALLRSGIVMLLLHASGNPAASTALQRIGRRHGPEGVGVTPELYERWMAALVDTVRACDPECTAEVESAWRTAVRAGLGVMIAAASPGVNAPGSSGRTR